MKLIARDEEKLGVLLGLGLFVSLFVVQAHNELFSYEFCFASAVTCLLLATSFFIIRSWRDARFSARIMAPFFANIGFAMTREEKRECRVLADHLKNIMIEERIFWGIVFGIHMSNASETASKTAQYVVTQMSLYAQQTRKLDKALKRKILNELFGICIYQYECIDYMSMYFETKHLTGGGKKPRHPSPRTSDPCSRYNKIYKECGMPRLVNTNLRKAVNQ